MGGKGREGQRGRKGRKGGRKAREKGRKGEGREGGRLRHGFWGMDAPAGIHHVRKKSLEYFMRNFNKFKYIVHNLWRESS